MLGVCVAAEMSLLTKFDGDIILPTPRNITYKMIRNKKFYMMSC